MQPEHQSSFAEVPYLRGPPGRAAMPARIRPRPQHRILVLYPMTPAIVADAYEGLPSRQPSGLGCGVPGPLVRQDRQQVLRCMPFHRYLRMLGAIHG